MPYIQLIGIPDFYLLIKVLPHMRKMTRGWGRLECASSKLVSHFDDAHSNRPHPRVIFLI